MAAWAPLKQTTKVKIMTVTRQWHEDGSWSFCSKLLQYCGSGSGIRCLFDHWIRAGMGKKSRCGIRIRDKLFGSYFRELRNNIFGGLKYLNSLMRMRIRESSKPEISFFRKPLRAKWIRSHIIVEYNARAINVLYNQDISARSLR